MNNSLFLELWISSRIYYYVDSYGGNKELEYIISTHPTFAYNYATRIIYERFKLGEEVIFNDDIANKAYQQFLDSL